MRQIMTALIVSLGLVPIVSAADKKAEAKENPTATKLLTNARQARATWHNFPGFTANLLVNVDGDLLKGKLDVSKNGDVELDLPKGKAKSWAQRVIRSLVGHRIARGGSPRQTPCAFAGDDAQSHPMGRKICVLNDELHSSYRIKDRQIVEVNRSMGPIRFTISVLENEVTKDKKFLPAAYVVNTWDGKTGALKRSETNLRTWQNVGGFHLPETATVVSSGPERLSYRTIAFTDVKLTK